MAEKNDSFEECIEIINEEIRKRKSKWNLQSLAWMDFDDVSQIIKIHINNKWHLYDSKQPLKPWLNRIISNQLKYDDNNPVGNEDDNELKFRFNYTIKNEDTRQEEDREFKYPNTETKSLSGDPEIPPISGNFNLKIIYIKVGIKYDVKIEIYDDNTSQQENVIILKNINIKTVGFINKKRKHRDFEFKVRLINPGISLNEHIIHMEPSYLTDEVKLSSNLINNNIISPFYIFVINILDFFIREFLKKIDNEDSENGETIIIKSLGYTIETVNDFRENLNYIIYNLDNIRSGNAHLLYIFQNY